jgi:competence protein CoiA
MRFALVGNERTPPARSLKGLCPGCGSEMIAKCGTERIHHWAHRGARFCDDWWEPETEWHRNWKLSFPAEWQEVIGYSESGEKHIADVRTERGFTLELQNSHIQPEERQAREQHYGADDLGREWRASFAGLATFS